MSPSRKLSPREQLHADWLGMLQPEGLVVSVPVLVEADAYVRQPPETQAALRALCADDRLADRGAFEHLLTDAFGWPANRLARPDCLEAFAVPLPDLGVVLRPDGALVDRDSAPLVFVAWSDDTLDAPAGDTRWPVSRHQRFERLLLESQTGRGAGTPVGLHACPTAVRLTYAPRGEAPGSLTFPIDALCTWDGRVLIDALLMLLGRERLFTVPQDRRLLALLAASRKRQEQVTVALAGQVEEALALLVAGVDVANTRTRGALLRDLGHASAPAVRDGLVGVLLRLVFLLYCEDSSVLPMDHALYLDNYSLARLVEKLEDDRVLYPEAMRHRYGAWAHLCALFRLVHGGIRHGDLVLPPRQGDLFDPDLHPWLEGRSSAHAAPGDLPPIDDGVIADVLDRLVYLENQRLSYRNLDVEQIGSVYEALMALEVHRCATRTVPIRGGGWLELGEVLDAEQPLRVVETATGLKERELLKRAPALARFKVTGDRRADEASLVQALSALLDGDRPERGPGQHVLVGGAERRRTGSHYTPTSLTRPIVERTLDPVLGEAPSSERILHTKVCDPAMGSGAFLAEACRYLSRRLLDAWTREGALPPADTGDPLLFARRMVAERCLYGVDKNPFAVQLARLSLWLVT
ncbi:MAG: N-6 DNA methylase, partial [Myxococcales bacterium]|nr:N-6 DNA methylase [Myxococcales bacterium]